MPRGAAIRFSIAGLLGAVMLYLAVFWEPVVVLDDPATAEPEQPMVAVPQIDSKTLAEAKDATHEERLFLEAAPMSHLLAQSLNVSDEAARALGMPRHMVPLDEVRKDPASWRGRYLYYRGKIEELVGPRPGHPVPGYGVYEARLRTQGGDAVLFTFSQPPASGIQPGAFVRAEGFLMKLRDSAYPTPLDRAPLLVGARLREDYEDWPKVTQLDPEKLATVLDVQKDGDRIVPADDSWRTLAEDQTLALWHLGSYVRDGDAGTPEQWREVPALNAQETWTALKNNDVARGEPMRILGTLAALRTIAAKPNPAGITEWTEAWIQVRDLGGKTIPVWLPDSVRQPLGASLEVRGRYFRRYSYETRRGAQIWTPLFVAAALDPFVFDTSAGMKEISAYAFFGAALLVAIAFWSTRRERRRSQQQETDLIERRRRRRTRLAAAAPPAAE